MRSAGTSRRSRSAASGSHLITAGVRHRPASPTASHPTWATQEEIPPIQEINSCPGQQSCALMPSMSNAPTAAPAPVHPDPHRAVSARLDSAGAGNILRLLLRTLFAYGRNLVETLRQSDYPQVLPWYPFLTTIFRTTNPPLITVTVIRGLLRLTALQHRLSNSLARARGSLLRLPLRDDRPAKRIDGGTRPGHGQPHAAGRAIPPCRPSGQYLLDRQIAAILRDICLDLGILSALTDPATRDELVHDLTLYGGDPAALISRSRDVQNSADPPTLAAVDDGREGQTRNASSRFVHRTRTGPAHGQPRRPDSLPNLILR
jgi:hypothetical protein